MSKPLWIAASILAALLIPAAVIADDGTFQVAAPSPLASGPGADLGPVTAISPDGQAWVAWKHVAPDATEAALMLASSPDWAPTVVAPLDPAHLAQTDLALRAEAGVILSWSQPATDTLTILQQTWPVDAPRDPTSWAAPLNASWAVGQQGLVYAALVENGAIRAMSNVTPLTLTLPISPTTIVTDLTLAVDSADAAHLAWVLHDSANESLGVYYAPVVSGTQPILVASSGQAPSLIAGPTGRVHLFWIADDGLRYANSTDWTRASLVSPGFLSTHQVALAVGADEGVHLAWSNGESLWRAHSADWRSSLQRLRAPAKARDPVMALDRYGRLHLTWVSENADDERETDLAYLRPLPFTLQVAVVHPQDGDVLARDDQARAILNGPAEEVRRIEYYLQVCTGAETGANVLRKLGIDRDGQDGWSVPLAVADLEPWFRYRVLALATKMDGSVIRAWGGWFTVQRPDLPGIWFQPPDNTAAHSQDTLGALLAAQPGQLRRLDLYLAPAACVITDTLPELPCPPRNSQYLGSYEPSLRGLWPAGDWQRFAYDRQRIPTGRYRPVAVGIDLAGNRICESSPHPVTIQDPTAPRIEITAPTAGAIIEDQLTITAQASDDNGAVRHVDFFLERPDTLLQPSGLAAGHTVSAPQLLWLGSDNDGADGWNLRVPVRSDMDGDGWRVRVMASDDQGLSAVARSPGTVSILGRPRPYLATLLPREGSRLWGVQQVSLFVPRGLEHLARAELYLEGGDGAWTYLGAMTDATDRLTFAWDTRDWPDGNYALIVVARHTDGHRSWLRHSNLRLQNGSSFYLLRDPAPGQVLSGTVSLLVESSSSASPLQEARFYYRLPGEALVPIAQVLAGVTPKPELSALWHTNTLLDGDYELVAILVDERGAESRVDSSVTVRNATPVVAFQDLQPQPAWVGSQEISWRYSSPVAKPVSVTIEYSPDDGAHWLILAREITATNTFSWTTEAYPDSTQGRLRLSATDGLLVGRSISPPFAVNNDNESPQVRLLGPLAGKNYHGVVPVAWHASDPDDDELRIDIAYRRGSGEWVNLAQGIPNGGSFAWDTQTLEPAVDYEVRVTAQDARGLTTTDSAIGVRLVTNNPPEVLLMWPHGGTQLEDDTVILWRATDKDNDDLRIDLYYSDNAGQTWIPLAEDVPNTGYYRWQVSFLPSGAQYRVRVVARDRLFEGEDRSDGAFAVGEHIPPTVRLVYPPAGAEIKGLQLVRWSRSSDGLGEAQATLLVRRSSQAAGAAREWIAVAENVADDGFYLWNTRRMADGQYELKLAIRYGEIQAESSLAQPLSIKNDSNHPPGVALLAPKGGELWSGWREIRWRAWDADSDPITATLSISSDGGQRWISLVTLDARAGQALWDTRTVPSDETYWLRIATTDGQATTQVMSSAPVHVANDSGYPPSVLLSRPQRSGSTERRIRVPWVAEDVDGDALTMGLALSDDGGVSWREVASNLYNAGQYMLEENLAPPATYRLRLRADDGLYQVETFASPSPTVPPAEAPRLALLDPGGGEHWSGEQEIRWQISGAAAQGAVVDIEFSRDGGQSWAPLTSNLKQVSSFLWNTRAWPNGVYFVRLALRTAQTTSIVTSEPLTLDNPGRNAPIVSLLSPCGGETWWGTREVRWRATDPDGDPLTVSISYSVDRGATWTPMAFPSSNTGSYIWDTTTAPNSNEVWLRAKASDGQSTVEDVSDGSLAIYNHRAPIVALLSPVGGEQWAGSRRISWLTTRAGNRSLEVAVQISVNAGKTWQTLAEDLPAQGSYTWDTSALPNQSRVLVRVLATDGAYTAVDMAHQPVIMRNHPQAGIPFFLP